MSEIILACLEKLPEFIGSRELVKLGLFPSPYAVYGARKRGFLPDYLKIGKKVLYAKASIIAFFEQRIKSGTKK